MTAGMRTVGEKGRAVFLTSQCHAHGVFYHGNRRVVHQAVEAKPRNVQDILSAQLDGLSALKIGVAVAHWRVCVNQIPVLVAVNAHAVGQEGIQPHDTPYTVANDLRKIIFPQ